MLIDDPLYEQSGKTFVYSFIAASFAYSANDLWRNPVSGALAFIVSFLIVFISLALFWAYFDYRRSMIRAMEGLQNRVNLLQGAYANERTGSESHRAA